MEPNSELGHLAGKVADGVSVDWDTTLSTADGGPSSALGELRIIADVAQVHRQLADPAGLSALLSMAPAPLPTRLAVPEIDPTARRWGALVVLELIGAGSFGEVFRAWDTSLDREVALKLMKRRRRRAGGDSIIREGQVLARVSHPNVMAIYGAREIDGEVGIWGEFLRGRTLARVVTEDGPLSAEETLVFADAICGALATVHREGLLHRDVKAQNVIREQGGRIVLMDFGLGTGVEDLATEGAADLAGTPLYLAPELFAGTRASVRTDIYSLGVLMFYLATDRYPVTGRSMEDVKQGHASGLRQRLQDLRPGLPPGFVHVVERALESDPLRRFGSCGEMQSAITAASHPVRGSRDEGEIRRRVLPYWGLGAAVLTGALLGGAAVSVWSPPAPAPAVRATIALTPPVGTELADSSRSMPALSPDGRYLAFVAGEANGDASLWRQDLATGEQVKIFNSDGAVNPFWSPSSDVLGFAETGGALRWGSPDGRRVDGVVDTGQEPRGATLSADGVLLYPKGPRSGLFQFTLATREERKLTELDSGRGEIGLMYPQFLSDNNRFVYFVWSNNDDVRGLYLSSLAGLRPVRLTASDSSGIVSGDTLLYPQGDDLMARDITANGELTSSVVAAQGVAVNWDFGTMATSSRNGALVFLPGDLELTELVWHDRQGRALTTVPLDAARHRSPAISHDGRYLAVQRYVRAFSQIEVFDLQTGQRRHMIEDSRQVKSPVWGPDNQLLYVSIQGGQEDLWVRHVDRDEPARLRLGGPENDSQTKIPMAWSGTGGVITFLNLPFERSAERPDVPVAARFELRILRGDGPSERLKPGEGTQTNGVISPDGRRVAYRRRQLGTIGGELPPRELWLCDLPACDNGQFLGMDGTDLAWPSNDAVSFLDSRSVLKVVKIPASAERTSSPSIVSSFATGVTTPGASRNNYAWAPDGTRVLLNLRSEGLPPLRLRLVSNWRSAFSAGLGVGK